MECEICAARGWVHPDDGSGHQCCGGHAGHIWEICPEQEAFRELIRTTAPTSSRVGYLSRSATQNAFTHFLDHVAGLHDEDRSPECIHRDCLAVWDPDACPSCGATAGHLATCPNRACRHGAPACRPCAEDNARAAESLRAQASEHGLRFSEAAPAVELGRLAPPPTNSVALGSGAVAEGPNSVAIGPNAHAERDTLAIAWGEPRRQITIGPDGRVSLQGFESPDEAASMLWRAIEEWNPLLKENADLTKKINELLSRVHRIKLLADKGEFNRAMLDQIARLADTDEPFVAEKSFPEGIVAAIRQHDRERRAP